MLSSGIENSMENIDATRPTTRDTASTKNVYALRVRHCVHEARSHGGRGGLPIMDLAPPNPPNKEKVLKKTAARPKIYICPPPPKWHLAYVVFMKKRKKKKKKNEKEIGHILAF